MENWTFPWEIEHNSYASYGNDFIYSRVFFPGFESALEARETNEQWTSSSREQWIPPYLVAHRRPVTDLLHRDLTRIPYLPPPWLGERVHGIVTTSGSGEERPLTCNRFSISSGNQFSPLDCHQFFNTLSKIKRCNTCHPPGAFRRQSVPRPTCLVEYRIVNTITYPHGECCAMWNKSLWVGILHRCLEVSSRFNDRK